MVCDQRWCFFLSLSTREFFLGLNLANGPPKEINLFSSSNLPSFCHKMVGCVGKSPCFHYLSSHPKPWGHRIHNQAKNWCLFVGNHGTGSTLTKAACVQVSGKALRVKIHLLVRIIIPVTVGQITVVRVIAKSLALK